MPGNRTHFSILALDVGEKRVGVALARVGIRVPVTLETLQRQAPDFWEQLAGVIKQHDIGQVVIGMPRGLEGQETAQTKYVQAFVQEFGGHFSLTAHVQDEALTSVQAKTILDKSGKPYNKADIDGVAASLILADYLEIERVAS